MANNLKDHLKEVADAIRAKKGTSNLINPQDFATEIEGISGGSGGGESGGSNIEYLDVSGLDTTNEFGVMIKNGLSLLSPNVKSKNENGTYLGLPLTGIQSIFGMTTNNAGTVIAVAIDFNTIIKGVKNEDSMNMNIKDFMTMMTGIPQEQLDAIPRLTKEQFYDLNA